MIVLLNADTAPRSAYFKIFHLPHDIRCCRHSVSRITLSILKETKNALGTVECINS